MELASRGSRAKRGHGFNLPMDPRPTLDAIARAVADAMEKSGVHVVSVDRPRPFGFGSAFRKDKWFATVPAYQNPGTSDLAPDPAIWIGRAARVNTRWPANGQEAIRPTRTWPQSSNWLPQSICGGREGCQYEPKMPVALRTMRSGCDQAWGEHSQALFTAFMDANPEVMFRDRSLSCVGEIQPYHRCYTRNHRALREQPIDHAQLCRLPDGSKFIVSQPYCGDNLCGECLDNIGSWQKEMPHLRWVVAGRERSWYFPNNANLLFLGARETLDSLTLDYPVPAESTPHGCERYPTHL